MADDVIGTRPTSAGLTLLAKAVAGKQLTFTRGAFGDSYRNGSYVNPSVADQLALTAMINERMSLPIADISSNAGDAIVDLLVKNANVTTTFQVREVGLFARDPDTNAEVLYCYIHYGDTGFIMPSAASTVVLEFFYQLTTAVGAAENVTALIDRTSLYTTLNKFLEHVNATNPHPNQPQYSLPTASSSTKGGVKVGTGLAMSGETLNATYSLPTASTSTKGGVKVTGNDGLIMSGETLKADFSNINTALSEIAVSIAALDTRLYELEHPPVELVLTLDTSAGKESDFDLSGDAALNTDGYFITT